MLGAFFVFVFVFAATEATYRKAGRDAKSRYNRRVDRRRLVLALPALATVLVVVVLFGPGQERPVRAARVMAAGGEPGGARSLRIETIERGAPIPKPVGVPDLSLFVAGQDSPIWTGETGPTGVVEAKPTTPVAPGSTVTLRSGGQTLARGALRPSPGPPPSVVPSSLTGVAEGDLAVTAQVATGVLVPSLPGVVSVDVQDGSRPVAVGKLTVRATSVEPSALEANVRDGRALVTLTVIAPPAVLELEAEARGRRGTLRVELPALMGAIGATATNDRLTLVSPAPRDVAFVSLFDRRGRIGGGVVDLRPAPDGFFRGEMPLEAHVHALTVASDAHETGAATATWPGPESVGAATAPHLAVVLDGMPQAVASEAARLSAVRTATTAALSLAAALEIALLLWTRQRARGALAPGAGDAPEELFRAEAASRPGWGFLAAISALVLLALAAVVGLVVLR